MSPSMLERLHSLLCVFCQRVFCQPVFCRLVFHCLLCQARFGAVTRRFRRIQHSLFGAPESHGQATSRNQESQSRKTSRQFQGQAAEAEEHPHTVVARHLESFRTPVRAQVCLMQINQSTVWLSIFFCCDAGFRFPKFICRETT